jgi:peroxiredoxin
MITGIALGKQARSCVINDFNDKPVLLSDYRGRKHVVLMYRYPAT